MSLKLSCIFYYLRSIPTLFLGIRNWPTMFLMFLGWNCRPPVIIQLRKTPIKLEVRSRMDIWILKETCLDKDYETQSASFVDGWTFIDIGAGIGDFTIDIAKRFPKSVIHAFEPFPESYDLLCRNIAINSVDNVKPYKRGVGGNNTEMKISSNLPQAVMQSTVRRAATETDSQIPIASTTLDVFFDEENIHQCDFLKIDCEGAEFEIFFSASSQTMAKIQNIAMEYHDGVTPHDHQELVDFFTNHGFRVHLKENPVHENLGLLFACR